MALTSWKRLLSLIEAELVDEPQVRNDLFQLHSLCDAADVDAFTPLSPAELTDQRLPALVLQLNSIVQGAIDLGISENIVSIEGLRPMATWDRMGRYFKISTEKDGAWWIGVNFVSVQ